MTSRGHRVRALVRDPAFRIAGVEDGLEAVLGDVLDPRSIEGAARGCAEVFHLAAVTTWASRPRARMWEVNVEGTRNVARAAVAAGVGRLVLASSVGIYGGRRVDPMDETTRPAPDTRYRESKLAAEQVVRSIAEREGLEHVTARLASVLGPGSNRWRGWIRALAEGRFRMIGRGRNHLHEVHVEDVVDGLERCMATPAISGRAYILASAEPAELGHAVEAIADELGVGIRSPRWPDTPFRALRVVEQGLRKRCRREPSLTQRYNLFLEDRRFSIARARAELGFAPRVEFLDALRAEARDFLDDT